MRLKTHLSFNSEGRCYFDEPTSTTTTMTKKTTLKICAVFVLKQLIYMLYTLHHANAGDGGNITLKRFRACHTQVSNVYWVSVIPRIICVPAVITIRGSVTLIIKCRFQRWKERFLNFFFFCLKQQSMKSFTTKRRGEK